MRAMAAVAMAVAVVSASSACERARDPAESCDGAAAAIVRAFRQPDATPPADSLRQLRAHCVEDRWTPTSITCIREARTAEAVDDCDYKQLTRQQSDLIRPIVESIDPIADQALAALRLLWDRACACTTAACASSVGEALLTWSSHFRGRRHSPPRVGDAKRKQLAAITERLENACSVRTEPEIDELHRAS